MKPTYHITITEQDRQKAQEFGDINSCIVATAAKRVMRRKNISCDTSEVTVRTRDGRYLHYKSSVRLGYEFLCVEGASYRPEVVGKSFTVTLDEQ